MQKINAHIRQYATVRTLVQQSASDRITAPRAEHVRRPLLYLPYDSIRSSHLLRSYRNTVVVRAHVAMYMHAHMLNSHFLCTYICQYVWLRHFPRSLYILVTQNVGTIAPMGLRVWVRRHNFRGRCKERVVKIYSYACTHVHVAQCRDG
jgi:hypothetical protein